MSKTKVFRNTAIALAVAGPLTAAMATNGMVLEGYGPISTGMGGASQAYDHGTAAMAQNPSTLSLMEDGARLEVAVGVLGPDITSSMAGMPKADSSGTAYMMPAIGYARKSNGLTYGIGMYAIGGMGTEYSANSFLALGTQDKVRSELGVGSVIFPLSYQVNSRFTVGGSLDFVWASMDLKMAAMGDQLGGMMTGGTGALGTTLATPGTIDPTLPARVDFSNNNDFSGAAKATGYGGKLGATFKASDTVIVGGSYHFKTKLGDMKTGMGEATLCANNGAFCDTGKISVVDFQWPAITAVGASWQATPALLLAADVKSIAWSDVMKSFNMVYESSGAGGMPGTVSFSMPQNWKDQTVYNLGGAYKVNSQLIVRAGVNLSDNPIPDQYVNPLFPATIKEHYTFGFGYEFDKKSAINASLVVAPEVEVTNAQGVKIAHSQTNWQLMYTHRY